MQTKLYNQEGQELGTMELDESIFGLPLNKDLLQQVRVAILANRRQNIAHTKDRAEVKGGGRKPWRQKGTGRARHGSIRSPIWKGGGVAHGPRKEKSYSQKINKKMASLALKTALSLKIKNGDIKIIDDFKISSFKTKALVAALKTLPDYSKEKSMMLVLADHEKNISRPAQNLPKLKVIKASDLNMMDVLQYKILVFTKEAIDKISKIKNQI